MRNLLIISLCGIQMLAGCAGEDGSPSVQTDDLLAPPPPGAGVQYRMTTRLDPGQEIERCQLFQAPPEGLSIRRDEVKFTPGSHHVVLYKTPYTAFPAQTLQGSTLDGTKVHDCNESPFSLWAVDGIAGGSQSTGGDTILGDLPDGVALTIPPDTVFVMNVHYLNSSPDAIDVDARINLHTIPKNDVLTEAGILFLYNDFIRIPANGTASARMRCPIDQDIAMTRVASHMHRRGVHFAAHRVTDANGSMEEIYTSDTWENVPARDFDPPLAIQSGQALDLRCDYVNPEARDVMQGLTTRDEMCLLLGVYFPRNPLTENCLDQNGFPADIWIGSGTATCAEAMNCVSHAKPPYEDQGNSLFGCVVDSCPGAAAELSAALHCQMTEGYGTCSTACSGAGQDCASCMTAACNAQNAACQSVACN